tara:strand:+ start:15019 stop:17022 length:2004 start_codon:yes stop_codon:yes gene_type:complete
VTIVENKISVAIIDDDIIERPNINSFPKKEVELLPILSDTGSHAFLVTTDYLFQKGLIKDQGDTDEISIYIESSEFVENAIIVSEYQQLFIEPFENLDADQIQELASFNDVLVLFLDLLNKKDDTFKPFFNTFSNDPFVLTKYNTRPSNNSDLALYDVIIMDIMMGDAFDDINKLAPYLGSIGNNDKSPIIFLISSTDQLNDEKSTYRAKAKSSSLAFSIINKSVLVEDNAQETIQLQYEQMLAGKAAAKVFNEFVVQFEKANKSSISKIEEELWNMDFSYLQQIYASTSLENYPFEQHLLGIVGSRNLFHLESSNELSEALDNLKDNIKNEVNKFQSFSSYSAIAVHDLESSVHFFGSTGVKESFNQIILNIKHIEAITINELMDKKLAVEEHEKEVVANNEKSAQKLAEDIGHYIPYGAVLIKGDISNSENVLIHCTQLCDLSRNIKRDGVNLVYVEAKITTNPNTDSEIELIIIPLPTSITNGIRYWLEVHPKKIVANSIMDSLTFLDDNNYSVFSFLRFDIVRQIRNEIFQNLSRKESAIRTGHHSIKARVLIRTINQSNNQLFDDEVFNDNTEVTLYQFGKTYHLIEQSHLDVIFWALKKNEISFNFSPSTLDDILKNKLPNNANKGQIINKVKFVVCKEEKLSQVKPIAVQAPIALIFCIK